MAPGGGTATQLSTSGRRSEPTGVFGPGRDAVLPSEE